MTTLGKPQRQHRIARLLEEQAISSQSQLVELLAADGVMATQATVSRDLEELGAVKVRIPGGHDGLRDPRARQGAQRARRPPAPGHGRVRGGGRAQREPGGAAHPAGLRARGRLRHRPGRRCPTCSAPWPATTRSSWCVPKRVGGAERRRRPRLPSPGSSEDEEASMAQRVVLAYSGGLDTSVAVKWITDEWGAEVVALAADVGQRTATSRRSASARSQPARSTPRSSTCASEFADEYFLPALRANALYEGKYPLVSALSRPVIAKHLVVAAARVRRRRRRARLHRQGQRPGPLRGAACARSRPISTSSRRCACGA